MFIAILVIVFFATFAFMVNEGIWNNAIALLQMIISGLVAFGCYQPLTVMADEATGGEYTYALDIAILWGLYFLTFAILKVLSELLSKTRMKFDGPVDAIGGPVLGLIAGYIMAGIVGASLHVSPLPKDGLGGGMKYDNKQAVESASMLTAIDIAWLKMVESASKAGFASGAEFSASDFVLIYGDRRERFEEAEGLMVNRQGR